MSDLKDWTIVEVNFYKDKIEIKLKHQYSPDGVLAISLIRYNGFPQMVATFNDKVIFRSGSLP